jgi:hypothetical protein
LADTWRVNPHERGRNLHTMYIQRIILNTTPH